MPRAPHTLAALTIAGALLLAPVATSSTLGRTAASSVSGPPMRKLRPGRYTLVLERLASGGLTRLPRQLRIRSESLQDSDPAAQKRIPARPAG